MAKSPKKLGPRAERELQREARAMVEQEVERFVRAKMAPELTQAARRAVAGFKRQTGR